MNIQKGKENLGKLANSSLIYRFLVAIVFVPFFLALFTYGGYPYMFFILGLIAVLSFEFFHILEAKGLEPYFKFGIVASVIVAITQYYSSANFTYFIFTLIIISLSVSELMRKNVKHAITHMSTTVFGVIYTGWLGGHFLLLRELSYNITHSAVLLLFGLYMIWMADTGAFFVGTIFGKHKILPNISPSKSYEGLVGGVLFSILSGYVFRYFWAHFIPIYDMIFIGIIAALGGLAGDLVESAMKRDAKIKDASSFLPGHGGVLDRFDSVLFGLPLLYYYFLLIMIPRL